MSADGDHSTLLSPLPANRAHRSNMLGKRLNISSIPANGSQRITLIALPPLSALVGLPSDAAPKPTVLFSANATEMCVQRGDRKMKCFHQARANAVTVDGAVRRSSPRS